jgi:site-specific DNA-methyltransferase (adenine-specific)
MSNWQDKLKLMRNQIIQGDAFETMGEMPANFARLVILHPPFNTGLPYNEYKDYIPWTQYKAFLLDLFALAKKIMHPDGMLAVINHPHVIDQETGAFINLDYMVNEAMAKSKLFWGGKIVVTHDKLIDNWEYKGEENHPIKYKNEFVNLAYKTNLVYGRRSTSIWNVPETFVTGEHPGKLSEVIALRLMHMFTNVGDWVVDPMCGIGTVPLMAYLLERPFIGIDMDADYVLQADETLRNHQ